MTTHVSMLQSPVGSLFVAVDDEGAVLQCSFGGGRSFEEWVEQLGRAGDDVQRDGSRTQEVLRQLEEYFASARRVFELTLRPQGTEFQRRVWSQLSTIPFGDTVSYLDVALAIDNVKGVRAVGRANGANPIAVIVPCHRVIGRDGSLVGYGGGMSAKRFLLEHERRQQALFD